MKRKWKSNLDELQEQKLLHIEKNSFWMLYFLLFAEIIVKLVLGKTPDEAICFLLVSVYMVGDCIRNGIWDRRLKADRRTNLLVSLAGAAVVMTANGVMGYHLFKKTEAAVISGLISAFASFVIIFLSMSVLSAVYKKRVKNMEEREEEEDD